MKLMKNKIIIYIGILIAGILLGWLFFGRNGDEKVNENLEEVVDQTASDQVWTCSMHPQIRQNEPGQCPICGMDLIPLEEEGGDDAGPNEVVMTETAIQLADIQTIELKKEIPKKTIYLNGRVKPDETRIYSQTAHIPGRIEKLYVNYTGERVRKGQKLASIYSPELINAQKELFEILNSPDRNPYLLEATRNKLKLWKFTDQQIKNLEENGELKTELDILADHSGYVYMRHVSVGDHLKEGQPILKIVNMNKIWVMFEAYESDLPWLNVGDKIDIHLEALPGETISGKINYIDPFIDPVTRVANIRVELNNPATKYKLDMFASGIVESILPIDEPAILVPKTAVLWTGKRSIVYVKVPNRKSPSFLLREIELGENAGEFYVVREGLEEGEEVVVNGVFKVDASAQLSGMPSMMNPEGGKTPTGHDHGNGDHEGMDMEPTPDIEEEEMQCAPGRCGGAK